MAEMGVDGLIAVPQRVGLEHVAHLDEDGLTRFVDSPEAKALRERVRDFKGVASVDLPKILQAELRPYQKDGFDFLAHLVQIRLGGILADDMGLGKTLQTLAWLGWLKERNTKNPKPSLVICPASVLHNWRREAERFNARPQGARPRKRRGAAQPAQTNSAARFDRDELRPVAARLGRVAEIFLPRGDP